jgi:hypothetical protein
LENNSRWPKHLTESRRNGSLNKSQLLFLMGLMKWGVVADDEDDDE